MFHCYILKLHKTKNDFYFYIGATSNLEQRKEKHIEVLKNGTHHNKTVQEKYVEGYDKLEWCEFSFDSREKAFAYEDFLIKRYLEHPKLTNIAIGYDNLSNHPDRDTLLKKRVKSQRKMLAKMTREERSERYGKFGKKNGMYGRTHTDESRAIISEKLQEHYKHNPSALIGIKRSEETRKKISLIASKRTGSKNPFFGKSHSQETKDKLRKARLGSIPSNAKKVSIEGVVYASATEAGRVLGMGVSLVTFRIRSKNERFVNWKWFECPTTIESVVE